MTGPIRVSAVFAAGALLLISCAGPPTKRETGALGGAALGAGVGALVGHATGNTAAGAAVGWALGGGRGRARQVSIEGHTDSKGSEEYNQRLSERRAEAVASALDREGVSQSRTHARGFGKKYPIAPNQNSDGSDNPPGRAKNRRVEV